MEVYQILNIGEVITYQAKKGRKYLYVKVGYEEKRFEEYASNVWREKCKVGDRMLVYDSKEKVREVMLDEQLKWQLKQLNECIGVQVSTKVMDVTDKTVLKMCVNVIQATLANVSNSGNSLQDMFLLGVKTGIEGGEIPSKADSSSDIAFARGIKAGRSIKIQMDDTVDYLS